MKKPIWYQEYDARRDQAIKLREEVSTRCLALGASAHQVLKEFQIDVIVRAVQESNWQEGIALEAEHTRELAVAAFDEHQSTAGPHLDMGALLRSHRDDIVRLKRRKIDPDGIAAYNLTRAHHAISFIGEELVARFLAGLIRLADRFEADLAGMRPGVRMPPAEVLEQARAAVRELRTSPARPRVPTTGAISTQGDLLNALAALPGRLLTSHLRVDHLHFLHRILFMGISRSDHNGRFRRTAVHVGNHALHFPPPAAVAGLMDEFCLQFPLIFPGVTQYDPILRAAMSSHRFVTIHPYGDGNGRLSRLLMNLVLWEHFPFVCLKADKRGRHRYSQALRRADNGNAHPLACLIAQSIIETYERLLRALNP